MGRINIYVVDGSSDIEIKKINKMACGIRSPWT